MAPRTQIVFTMKNVFEKNIIGSGRGSDMIVSDNVLQIWIELIKCRNDNAMEKFYGLPWSPKVVIFD